jgi:hypothetical protein
MGSCILFGIVQIIQEDIRLGRSFGGIWKYRMAVLPKGSPRH